MSFGILFKGRFASLHKGNAAIDDILGNYTCKIASGEWDDFISLGLTDRPDENLMNLANIFLSHCFKSRIQTHKLLAYAEIANKYGEESSSYTVKRTVVPAVNRMEKLVIADEYTIESLKDLIFLEMLYSTEQNMHISRCKNCFKYFSSANAGADYCDRIFKDDKTCKWVGSKKTYFSNIKSDENLVLYEKVYQSLQYKKRRTADFEVIKSLEKNISVLRAYRLKYKSGEISAEKFTEKLNDIKDNL